MKNYERIIKEKVNKYLDSHEFHEMNLQIAVLISKFKSLTKRELAYLYININ